MSQIREIHLHDPRTRYRHWGEGQWIDPATDEMAAVVRDTLIEVLRATAESLTVPEGADAPSWRPPPTSCAPSRRTASRAE